MYSVVQLHFNLTLDTTILVSRDFNVLGAGDIYPTKRSFNIVTQIFLHPLPSSQSISPVFICDGSDAVIEMLLSPCYSLFFICSFVLFVYFKVYEGEFPWCRDQTESSDLGLHNPLWIFLYFCIFE